ncbi:MAG: DUF6132 family protein [Vicinamibacterales bacterium]
MPWPTAPRRRRSQPTNATCPTCPTWWMGSLYGAVVGYWREISTTSR